MDPSPARHFAGLFEEIFFSLNSGSLSRNGIFSSRLILSICRMPRIFGFSVILGPVQFFLEFSIQSNFFGLLSANIEIRGGGIFLFQAEPWSIEIFQPWIFLELDFCGSMREIFIQSNFFGLLSANIEIRSGGIYLFQAEPRSIEIFRDWTLGERMCCYIQWNFVEGRLSQNAGTICHDLHELRYGKGLAVPGPAVECFPILMLCLTLFGQFSRSRHFSRLASCYVTTGRHLDIRGVQATPYGAQLPDMILAWRKKMGLSHPLKELVWDLDCLSDNMNSGCAVRIAEIKSKIAEAVFLIHPGCLLGGVKSKRKRNESGTVEAAVKTVVIARSILDLWRDEELVKALEG